MTQTRPNYLPHPLWLARDSEGAVIGHACKPEYIEFNDGSWAWECSGCKYPSTCTSYDVDFGLQPGEIRYVCPHQEAREIDNEHRANRMEFGKPCPHNTTHTVRNLCGKFEACEGYCFYHTT